MGEGRTETAGVAPYLAGDVGEWRERERGDGIQIESRPFAGARASGKGGGAADDNVGAARGRGVGVGDADGDVGAAVAAGRGWLEVGDDLTGGPHLSASQRGEEAAWAGPARGRGAGERWASPTKKKEGEEWRKRKKIFLGFKILHFANFNWLKLLIGLLKFH
uniref:Uncharacterized protein n=1 Tax=Oryza sativa subsp. japonica TaxID=39947 RepID=Q6YUN8_ORYSJ|nr:hypothetical protein [Oryza sativa Japonica Group]BAD17556.1 hypothetical protein [Oryza sativa Japonica Group]